MNVIKQILKVYNENKTNENKTKKITPKYIRKIHLKEKDHDSDNDSDDDSENDLTEEDYDSDDDLKEENDNSYNDINSMESGVPQNNINQMNDILHSFERDIASLIPSFIDDKHNFKKKHFYDNIDKARCKEFNKMSDYEASKDDIREFKDNVTDIVNFQIKSDTGIYDLLFIINKLHIDVIKEYRAKMNLKKDSILFVYKGGNLLLQIVQNFMNRLPGDVEDILKNTYEPYFAKSDLDYSVYIDPKLENYDEIFNDICHLCYLIQILFKDIVHNSPHIFFDWYKYDNEYKNFILYHFYNEIKKTNRCTRDPKNGTFYHHEVVNILFENNFARSSIHNYKNIHNKFITKKGGKVEKCDLYTENSNSLYVSYNDSLEFGQKKNTSFNLVRTKFNFVLVINDIKKDEEYTKNVGGELLDVSIIGKKDDNLIPFFDDLYNNIYVLDKTRVKTPPGYPFKGIDIFEQYIYSINYMFYDLRRILFETEYYPWKDRKYKKRLYRLFFISIIDYYNKQSEIQRDAMNEKIDVLYNFIINIEVLLFGNNKSNLYFSLEYAIKYKKNDIEWMKKIKKDISRFLNNNKDMFDFVKHKNAKIVKILRKCMFVIEKFLFNYNYINKKIYTNQVVIDSLENIDNKMEDLDNLKEFVNIIKENLIAIKECRLQVDKFCETKHIDEDFHANLRFNFHM